MGTPHSHSFRHQHLSSHSVLSHSLDVSKPSLYSLIHSTRQHPAYSSQHTSSFLTLSIRDTPTKFLKHFISRIFTFVLSALLIRLCSAPRRWYNNYSFIQTRFRIYPQSAIAQHTFHQSPRFYASFITCTTDLSHPPSSVTCHPMHLKQYTSFNCSPFRCSRHVNVSRMDIRLNNCD